LINILKNKKLIYKIALIIVGFIILLVASIYYKNKFSKTEIYKNVLNQDGYKVFEIQKPIHFAAYIEPNWIPKKENKVIELKEVIGEVGSVKIIVESIIHRGNDIYFNFDAIPNIKYNEGAFLYNSIINKDGTATSYNLADSFNIFNYVSTILS
jgi:hypothetical protein